MIENIIDDNITFFPKVCVKITSKCNLMCPFCCEPNRDQIEPSLDDLTVLANRLCELGINRISITGGEPLLHKNLSHFLKLNKNLGIYNLLLTSDPFLLKIRFDEIVPYIDSIRFSIHGIGSKHDEVVGKVGVFKECVDVIKKLKKHDIEVCVTTVVTFENINNLNRIAKWCVHNSISKLYLFRMLDSGHGEVFKKKHGNPSISDFEKKYVELTNDFSKNGLNIYNYNFDNKPTCIVVYGDGRIICEPCEGYPNAQKTLGNIVFDSPSLIWQKFLEDEGLSQYIPHLKISLR